LADTASNKAEHEAPHEEHTRRDFIHIAAIAAAAGGLAAVVWPLVDQMNPSSNTTTPRSPSASRW